MFEQTFVGGKTNKTWTVLVSFLGQIVIIIIAILIPMIYYEALPQTQLTSFLVAPPPPPPPPPPPAAAPIKVVKVIPRLFDAGRLMAPKAVPKDIALIKEDELPPPASAVAGVVGGVPGGVPGGVVTEEPLRVGGAVTRPEKVSGANPVYTEMARKARLTGIVIIEAIIDERGNVVNARILKGLPMGLDRAALDAVQNWRFKPATLQGRPVKVYYTLTVNFQVQ